MLQKGIRISARRYRLRTTHPSAAQLQKAAGVPLSRVPVLASDDRRGALPSDQSTRPTQELVTEESMGATLATVASKENYSTRNPPPYEIASKKDEYWRFIEWSATFKPLRRPASQADLAAELHLDPARLSQWKWMPEFNIDVFNAMMKIIQGNSLADAFHGWMARLPTEGRAADMKLLLEWLQGFKSTKRYEGNLNLTARVAPPQPPQRENDIPLAGRKLFL